MGIFAGNERFFRFLLGFGLEHGWRRIAEIVKSRITGMAVVERQTGAVEGYDRIVHRLDVWPYPTLVAETPEDDARVVIVALH